MKMCILSSKTHSDEGPDDFIREKRMLLANTATCNVLTKYLCFFFLEEDKQQNGELKEREQ